MWTKTRNLSTRLRRVVSLQTSREVLPNFRTYESNPLKHSVDDSGLFYTLSPDVCKTLFSHGGLPMSFTKQSKTFTETCLMVRDPALEIIDYINRSDLSKPVNRYVLYGDNGVGKSLSMAHLIHYASEAGFLLVHVPWVSEWLRRVTTLKEISHSTTREGFIDLPLDAAAWLVHFKLQNSKLLKELDLRVTKEYTWSKREVTEAGSPLMDLVDLGFNRVKYASDIIVALVDEIKELSKQNKCKTFVAIDGFNCFYYPLTKLKTQLVRQIPPKNVTLTIGMLELTKNDWCNAVTLLCVDKLAVPTDMHESYYPKYLLTKEGFEHLDPFIPIEVKKYTEKEFISCTAYYRDRLWLRGSPNAEEELAFTTAKNPYNLMLACAPL